jgi:hypothetical protein
VTAGAEGQVGVGDATDVEDLVGEPSGEPVEIGEIDVIGVHVSAG